MVNQKKITNLAWQCKMRVMERREMKMKSCFPEQALSVAHACDTNIPPVFGVKGGCC